MSAQWLLCKASTFSSEPRSELLHSNSCAQSLLWHFFIDSLFQDFSAFLLHKPVGVFFLTLTEYLILTLIVARPDPAGSFQVRLSESSQENILYWPFCFFFSWNNTMCTSVSYFHPDQKRSVTFTSRYFSATTLQNRHRQSEDEISTRRIYFVLTDRKDRKIKDYYQQWQDIHCFCSLTMQKSV